MTQPWHLAEVADTLAAVLIEAEAELRLEQAVHGLDAREEVALHALLAERLSGRYAVAREVHYPSSAGRKRSHRQRCDLVLAPLGRPLRLDWEEPDLFAPRLRCEPQDALWLEVKVAHQLRADGRAHRGYGALWRGGVTGDLRKMAADPLIRHAALVLIVFTESELLLEKDLGLMESVLVRDGVLAGFRQVRSAPILERRGHRLCALALWPTQHGG